MFSKIRNDTKYHPSKETIILLGLSLKLSISELEKLLESASYYLPKNNPYDLIIRFCFIHKIYSIKKINEYLEKNSLNEFLNSLLNTVWSAVITIVEFLSFSLDSIAENNGARH